jgi:hypothetical protein|tara:strand:- start:105 stop:470 length:366 start_codon:yes stop_codon:yes gene_type:complete
MIVFDMYNLFLDDIRNPWNVAYMTLPKVDWIIVRNYDEFVKEISTNGLPEIISFDHDLSFFDIDKTDGFIEKTGYDCAKWLINYCSKNNLMPPTYYVHSMNPVGKQNIINYIECYIKSLIK